MKAVSATTALLVLLLSSASVAVADCGEGAYSKAALLPSARESTAAHNEFPSPDGYKKIVLEWKSGQPEVFVREGGKQYSVPISPWPCPEFQWSPDSKAFFISYSDGGSVGNYKTLVVFPSAAGIRVVDPTFAVEKDFLTHYPKCFDPETPNLGGVAWQGDAKRLLLAAQVLPHSNCDMMGTFSLYEIEVPSGRIIKKHGQLAAKKTFGGLLGSELRYADDGCFRNPGSCNIPQLHGEGER